jgi:predicted lipoprotein
MRAVLVLLLCLASPLAAQDKADVLADIVDGHILPRVEAAAATAGTLAGVAATDCTADAPALRAAYDAAFDAWIAASHLRFGPALDDNRMFALGFWPDTRGAAPRALAALIAAEDPMGADPAAYAEVSVAARGFHALDLLLFDEALSVEGAPAYRCTLVGTIAADIAATTAAIRDGWTGGYAESLRAAGTPGNALYPTEDDALRALLGAATTELQFTSDVRLGRPLGTFEQAYPARAEAWRSGRSLRNVEVSVANAGDFGRRLAVLAGPEVAAKIDSQLGRIETVAGRIDDSALAGVATPQGRFRIEALQTEIDALRLTLGNDLAPALGIAAGFNALDGD